MLECDAARRPGLQRPQAQSLLGRFLFSGWEAHEKPVSVLSGGERRRLALALVVASGANFLVLDEPTNHLDLEIREALEAALESFPATVLLVSHDRALLDAVAERTLAIEDGTIRSYDGGWADYVAGARARGESPVARATSSRRRDKPETRARAQSHEAATAEAAAASWSRSRPRSPRARRRSPTSSGSSPTTGATSRSLTAHRAARDELQALLDRWEDAVRASAGLSARA